MRHTTSAPATGESRTRRFGARHAFYALIIAIVVLWGGAAFAQEAYLSHKLNQQAADLRSQNAVLAAQNQAYHKDVNGLSSGSASEEQARINGYARPNEHVYVITVPPSPSPTPSPSPKPGKPPAASPSASPTGH